MVQDQSSQDLEATIGPGVLSQDNPKLQKDSKQREVGTIKGRSNMNRSIF